MSETPKYDRDRVERLLFQMDNMLHTRVNSLLLAETIFFLAAAAVWQHLSLLIIVGLLGIITTILFGLTNLKLYFRVIWLIKQFKQLDPFYHDYLRMSGMEPMEWDRLSRFVFTRVTTDNQPKWLDTGWLYAWGLSFIYLSGWIAFLLFGIVAARTSVG